MEEIITSLCYVDNHMTSTVRLCRIADLINGRFVPYSYTDTGIDFYDSERDLLIGSAYKITATDGSLGIYDWYAHLDASDKWRTEVEPSDFLWTEIAVTGLATLNDVLLQLRKGWNPKYPIDCKRDYIFCGKINNPSSVPAVYVPAKALTYSENAYRLTDDILFLEYGTVDFQRYVGSCQCRYSQNDSRCYLFSQSYWQPEGTLQIKTNEEIIETVVSASIGKLDKDVISRKEKQSIRKIIKDLSLPDLADTIAEKLNCSHSEAEKQITEYFSRITCKIEQETVSNLIAALLRSDNSYLQELYEQVEIDWKAQNAAQLASAQKDIDAVKQQLDHLAEEKATEEESLKELRSKQKGAEKRIEELIQFQAEIQAEIEARLAEIPMQKAKALVESCFNGMLITSSVSPVVPSNSGSVSANQNTACDYRIEFDGPASEVQEDELINEFDNMVEVLEKIFHDKGNVNGFAILMFALFARRQHLIISGESSVEIAKAYTQGIIGYPCPVIHISDKTDPASLVKELTAIPHSVVCFANALHSGYEVVRDVMRSLPDMQVIITLNHSESLVMEPSSLFSVFLPIDADYFCQGPVCDIPSGYDCSIDLEKCCEAIKPREISPLLAAQNIWFSGKYVAPILRNRCAYLQLAMRKIADACQIDPKQADNSFIEYIMVPLILALHGKNTIHEALQSITTLSEKAINRVLCFCGIEDE